MERNRKVLSYLLSAMSLARHAVALTLVAGAAATTLVAGSVDQIGTQPQHKKAPMTSPAPTTRPEPTAKPEVTLSLTAKSTTFETSSLPETTPRRETKTNEVGRAVKDCLTKYAAASDSTTAASAASEVCRRAIEASGLSATEFWAKFGKPQTPKSESKPITAPNTTKLTQLTKYCLTLHAALTTASSHEQVERMTTVCNQAIAESKLTPTQFWTKFSASR